MSDLANLYIKVDSSGVVTASRDLNKLTDDSRQVEKATDAVGTGFNKLKATVTALAASYAVLKIAQYTKEIATMAAQYEMLGVAMAQVGKNAFYSSGEMEAAARGMQKLGISMIESRQQTIRMVQAQLDLTKAGALARVAQDTARIANINSSEAFSRLVQGIRSGETKTLETLGIQINLEAAYRKFEQTNNMVTGSITAGQKAQAAMNAVLEEGKKSAGLYAETFGLAGGQIKSFQRFLDDFKVKMGEAFNPATATVMQAVTTAMKGLQDEVSKPEAKAALAALSKEFATLAVSAGKELPGALAKTISALNQLMSLYNALPGEVVGAAGAGIIGRMLFGAGGFTMVAGLSLMNSALEKVNMNVGSLPGKVAAAMEAIKNIQDVVTGKKDWMTGQTSENAKNYAGGVTGAKTLTWDDPNVGKRAREALALQEAAEAKAAKAAEEAAAKRKKAIEEITEATRKAAFDLDSIGKTEYEKDLIRIAEEADKYRKAGVDKVTIAKFTAAEIAIAEAKLAEEIKKAIERNAGQMASSMEIYYDNEDKLKKDAVAATEEYEKQKQKAIEKTLETWRKAGEDATAQWEKDADEGVRLTMHSIKTQGDAFHKESADREQAFSSMAQNFAIMGQLYAEDSKERQALSNLSKAATIGEMAVLAQRNLMIAVGAVVQQGTGDPYSAFARIAAMIAVVTGVLSIAGIAFGGGGGGGAAPSAAYGQNTTVLGGANDEGSQSVANSFKLMEDTYTMEDTKLTGIWNSMKDLNQNITGLVTGIVKMGAGTFQGFEGVILNQLSPIISGIAEDWSLYADKIFAAIDEFLFGSTKIYSSGSGIKIGAGSAGQQSITGYQNVTTEKSGSLFNLWNGSTDTEQRTIALSNEVTDLLTKVFKNFSTTFEYLAKGFGTDTNAALNYMFPEIDWNLQDKTAEEIDKYINEQISAIGDTAVAALFGTLISQYQQVGEGLLETAIRLVVDKESVLKALEMTGQAFSGTAMEAVSLSEELIKIAGGLDKLTEAASTYYDKFFTDAEKQTRLGATLTTSLGTQGTTLPGSRADYRTLVESLDLTNPAMQKLYVLLMQNAEAADQYYKALEDGLPTVLSAIELAKQQRSLDIQLMDLQGKAAEVLAAQRADELAATDTLLRPTLELIYAQQDLNAANAAAKTATDELAAATKKAADDAAAGTKVYTDAQAMMDERNLRSWGDAVGAAAGARQAEMDAMIKQYPLWEAWIREIFQREDALTAEAAATAAATKAAEDAAAAATKAAAAYKTALEASRDFYSALVDQGKIIRDFLKSLGETGFELSLGQARKNYMGDLAGARAGSADAYGNITSSAGAYIGAGEKYNTEEQQRRLVGRMKAEMGNLAPYVKLDENLLALGRIEAELKRIDEASQKTAGATGNLDLLGIKANFDLESVYTVTQVLNSNLSPEDKAIALAVSSDLQRTVTQIIDSNLSTQDKGVALATSSTLQRTVALIAGSSTMTDADRAIALAITDGISKTVNFITGSTTMTEADKSVALLATEAVTKTINTIAGSTLGYYDLAMALLVTKTVTKTIDVIAGSTLTGDDKTIAMTATATVAKTINAVLGNPDVAKTEAGKLALLQFNTLTANVSAAALTGDSNAIKMATTAANAFSAKVTATLTKDNPTDALATLMAAGGAGVTVPLNVSLAWNTMGVVFDYINSGTGRTAVATEYMAVMMYKAATKAATVPALFNYADASMMEYFNTKNQTGSSFADGGIASGSMSGYGATLHGTELVVSPRTSYPATVNGGDNGVEQTALLKKIVSAIESGNFQIAKNTGKLVKINDRWDGDGMPPARPV